MLIVGVFVNATIGGFAAEGLLGVPAVAGAIVGGLLSFVYVMPAGSLGAGVLVEVWTGEIIKKLRAADQATWLDGVPDYSQYAENDVIHLVDAGADPDVLINNTSYPIDVQALGDDDAVFGLDKFQTKATPITDDELYALSYDKRTAVQERHGKAIQESKYKKAIHALAPASNAAKTPVVFTTGAYDGDSITGGRKRITRKDIIGLKQLFDKMEVPQQGRRLVLCSDHVGDLLIEDQTFRDQYYNYTSGKIANMYGFEVYEYIANPVYNQSRVKQAVGTASSPGTLYQASVAFYTGRVFKATGTTKMYYSEAATDPLNQRSLINFRHMFICLPKKSEALAAIVSDFDTDTEAAASSTLLSALALSAGEITFNPLTRTYNVAVENAVEATTVTATQAQAGQVIRLRGVTLTSGVASGSIALAEGVNNLYVRVVSANGEFEDKYTIVVTRAAGVE